MPDLKPSEGLSRFDRDSPCSLWQHSNCKFEEGETAMLPNPYKDAEFGAKLDAIEGLIGFRYEASKF